MTLLLKFGYFLYDKLTKMLCRGGLLLGVQVRHVKKKVKKMTRLLRLPSWAQMFPGWRAAGPGVH